MQPTVLPMVAIWRTLTALILIISGAVLVWSARPVLSYLPVPAWAASGLQADSSSLLEVPIPPRAAAVILPGVVQSLPLPGPLAKTKLQVHVVGATAPLVFATAQQEQALRLYDKTAYASPQLTAPPTTTSAGADVADALRLDVHAGRPRVGQRLAAAPALHVVTSAEADRVAIDASTTAGDDVLVIRRQDGLAPVGEQLRVELLLPYVGDVKRAFRIVGGVLIALGAIRLLRVALRRRAAVRHSRDMRGAISR